MFAATKTSDRLGVTFHRTFSLNRPAIAEILRVAITERGQVNNSLLREQTNLGTIYIEAMPRYARGCGLLDLGSFAPTRFGELALAHDPTLKHPATQWLMHYYLSAPQGPGPRFWHYLVTHTLRPGDVVDRAMVASEIARGLAAGEKLPGEGALNSTATVFLGSYAKPEGLQALGLLAAEGRNRYRVQAPDTPPMTALAVALADYWAVAWGERVTVSLQDLMRSDGFMSLFFLSTDQLEAALQAMQRARLLELHRLAPPYQVVRLWDDPAALVERLYEDD